ncbi:MAG: autotransporter domain-containing protein [Chitinophagaceae bacterium]|nr:MAG: autotransporter domain-containing protein [Chitinophagaceae bacterium]
MRKFYFLAIASVCFSFLSQAQIRKGSVYLGGDINISSQKEEQLMPMPGGTNSEGKNTFIYIGPAVGIAIKENVFAGVDFLYGKSDSKYLNSPNSSKVSALAGGIFIRRYFPLANKFYLFGQVRLGYQKRNEDQTSLVNSDRIEEDSWSVQANLFPGLSYNVYKSLYFEMGLNNLLQLGYLHTDRTQTSALGGSISTESKTFNLQSDLSGNSLNIGVRFVLPKK